MPAGRRAWRRALNVLLIGFALAAGGGCGLLPEPPPAGTAPPVDAPATSPPRTGSPDGLGQVQRAAMRVRNIACAGIGSGSGFALDEHLLVTNAHVIEGASVLQLSTYDGREIEVGTADAATVADLALVRTTEPMPATVPIAAADPQVGDLVSVVGYPGGGPLRTTAGTVVGYVDDALGVNVDQVFATTAEVEPGSSGSAVVDEAGTVVGVIYAKGDSGRGYAVPVSALRRLLDQPDQFVPLAPCG